MHRRILRPHATVSASMWFITHRILRDLRHAGFAEGELRAVRDTPAMWAQLTRFVRQGGRIERVDAAFSAATGQPGLIRFFCPPAPAVCTHASYGALAHELGHALQCPQQWRALASFADAESYARAREMGEAHAWLNQYRLCRDKVGGQPEAAQVQLIENEHDFGTQAVDLFARMAAREAAGWPEARILDELAMLNAHMFPSGMGDGNFKTYGQCNRWDWLQACRPDHPRLREFVQQLARAPGANEQKVLMKFKLLDDAPGAADDGGAALTDLATALGRVGARCALSALYELTCAAVPSVRAGTAFAQAGDTDRRPASAGTAQA